MSEEHLINEDAIEKLKSMVKKSSTCMLATQLDRAPIHVCPMQVQEVDNDGNLWFFSNAESRHNHHIVGDHRAQAIFTNVSDMEFLTVFGEATTTKDRERIERLWNPLIDAWFEGKNDPNITLICLKPTAAHYWDTENGKLITMAKIITRAMTGSNIDVGVEGDLRV